MCTHFTVTRVVGETLYGERMKSRCVGTDASSGLDKEYMVYDKVYAPDTRGPGVGDCESERRPTREEAVDTRTLFKLRFQKETEVPKGD